MAKKDEIDNAYEFADSALKRHWWKIAILLLLGGLVFSGYTIKGCNGKTILEKEELKIKKIAGEQGGE